MCIVKIKKTADAYFQQYFYSKSKCIILLKKVKMWEGDIIILLYEYFCEKEMHSLNYYIYK